MKSKKFLSWLLVLAMVLSLMPAMSLTASAKDVHSHDDWTAWTSATSLPTKAGNYYLDTDVTISSTWDFSKISRNTNMEMKLCLNGHVIKMTGASKSVINLKDYAGRSVTLSVYDCDTTTQHKFSVDKNGLWKLDEANGTETVVGGVITGGTNSGVYIDNMTTSVKQVFNLYGGNIVGNTAGTGSGGGVANRYDVFNMYGGSIFGNTATSAGGVQVMHGTFTMTGGTIHDNTATDKGGGVALTGANGDATFIMSNAEIQNNKAPHFGGVFNSSGKIYLSGKVIIKNNTDANGNSSNVGTYPVITINGALTDSEIYICRSSANGSFATEGTLTKDYISKSGASVADDLDKFFHYDGPSQYELLLKDNEIYMQKLSEAVSVKSVETMPSFTYGAATEAAKIADVTAKNFTGTANCSVVGWYNAATDGTALTSNTPTAVLVGTELKITTTATTPAGDYYLELSASNGTVTKTTRVKVTVAKDTNTLTGTPSVSGWTYGTTPGSASGVTSKYGTVSYKYYSDAGCTVEITPSATTTVGTYYAKAFVAEGDNYNEASSESISFTVSKADATDEMKKASGNLKAKNGSTVEVTLPDLPDGASYGTVTNSNSAFFTVGTISNGKVTVTSAQDWPKGTESKTFTVKVTGATNYDDYYITVTIAPMFKTKLTVSDVSMDKESYTYGDTVGYTGTVSMKNGEDAVTGITPEYTYYQTSDKGTTWTKLNAAPTNAGDYKLVVSVPESNENYEGSQDVPFSIIPSVTIYNQTGKKVCSTSADPKNGEYTLPAGTTLKPGTYQVITELGSKTITSVLVVEDGKDPETTVTIPTKEVSSEVEIKTTAGTPKITVDGLDTLADTYTLSENESITVTMTVEAKPADASSAAQTAIKTVNDAQPTKVGKFDFVDMSIIKESFTNGISNGTDPVHNANAVLEIIVPFTTSGRKDITVFRYHGSAAAAFEKLEDRPTGSFEDGTYFVGNGFLVVYAQFFSEYAIGYNTVSSGGGSVSNSIIVPADIEHGKLTSDKTKASSGEKVTITVTPDKSYTLETLTVKDANGKEIELTRVNDTTFTFKMPGSKVTVEATFMEDNSMLNFFVDVKATDYYYDAVLWAAENGITTGADATHFNPNGGTTRAHVVTFLWRAAGCPEPKSMNSFADVVSGSYYEKAVAWAIEQGITKGTSETAFSPDMICTRAQIAAFMARYAGVADADCQTGFTDVSVNAYYASAVAWMLDNGVTEGTTATTYSPDADCTRAQIVTFLYRWMVK